MIDRYTPAMRAKALRSLGPLPATWKPHPATIIKDRTVAHATVGPVTVLTEDAKPKRISRTIRRIG